MVDYAELRKELYEKFHDAYHKLHVSELKDQIERLRAENEAILAANRDVMLHWDVLKADYEQLRAALDRIGYTKAGEAGATLSECVKIARAALAAQPAPGKEEA